MCVSKPLHNTTIVLFVPVPLTNNANDLLHKRVLLLVILVGQIHPRIVQFLERGGSKVRACLLRSIFNELALVANHTRVSSADAEAVPVNIVLLQFEFLISIKIESIRQLQPNII